MKIPYTAVVVHEFGGTKSQVHRPLVSLRIFGPPGFAGVSGLADTGADDTLLPDYLIERLGIVTRSRDRAVIAGIGGSIVIRYAVLDLEIATSGETYRWSARFGFHPGHQIILGHQGFFDGFTASFNGRRRLLTLTPNGTALAPLYVRGSA